MKCLLCFSLYLVVFLDIQLWKWIGKRRTFWHSPLGLIPPAFFFWEVRSHQRRSRALRWSASQVPHSRASSAPKKNSSSCLLFSTAAVFVRLVDSQFTWSVSLCRCINMTCKQRKGAEMLLLVVTQISPYYNASLPTALWARSADLMPSCFSFPPPPPPPSSKLVNYLNAIISFTAGNDEGS